MKHTCYYCKGKLGYHEDEAKRISVVIEQLDPNLFKPDGIVNTILRERVIQELEYERMAK